MLSSTHLAEGLQKQKCILLFDAACQLVKGELEKRYSSVPAFTFTQSELLLKVNADSWTLTLEFMIALKDSSDGGGGWGRWNTPGVSSFDTAVKVPS